MKYRIIPFSNALFSYDLTPEFYFMGETKMTESCQPCQGNGEIVTDWERYLEPHLGDKGDEAVAECPDCDGEGAR